MGNSISFHGHLGRDAESKQAGQSNVVEFSVGNNVGYGDKKTTNWFKCAMWGKSGENVLQYLKKGQLVFVRGELTIREYEKNDGAGKGYSFDVRVDGLELLGKREDGAQHGASSAPKSQADSQQQSEDMPF